ncbi:hypothetical protein HF526_00285 [Pseudonocardia sp. K10HN5]|uniref:BCCT, betaine/carnitine/choline family transporter n=2 Tax=Pseudonocardia acidicola TaxID=2724939 RepID=A0ABX1S2I7_9PSEU|nr:hypothetical protein [Pseudonocardia acidicola]
MVDGISGTDLHNVVLDPTPAPRAPVPDLIGAVMLLVGGDTALTGIQNLTIITAAPFAVVMVLLCVSLARDLRSDPLVRRDDRTVQAVEQAVEYGIEHHDDDFFLNVKPMSEENGSGR